MPVYSSFNEDWAYSRLNCPYQRVIGNLLNNIHVSLCNLHNILFDTAYSKISCPYSLTLRKYSYSLSEVEFFR